MKRAGLVMVAVALVATVAVAPRTASHPTVALQAPPGTPVAGTPAAGATPPGLTFAELKLALVAQADLAVSADGTATLTVATLALPPGSASKSFITRETLVVAVQAGSVRLDADEALVGAPDIAALIGVVPVTVPAGPAVGTVLQRGQQAVIPAGTGVLLVNPGPQAATLLLVTLGAAAPPGSPTP